jgi:hypothetical protein
MRRSTLKLDEARAAAASSFFFGAADFSAVGALRLRAGYCSVSVPTLFRRWRGFLKQIQVAILFVELPHFGFAGEVSDPLLIPFAHFHHESWKGRPGIALAEVLLEVAAVAPDRIAKLGEPFKQLEHVLELSRGEDLAVGEVLELHFLGAERDENAIERGVVIDVFLALLALDEIERRAGDIDVALAHEVGHLPVEEGEQQSADVRAVHVGVGHDDDAAVAELREIERAFLVAGRCQCRWQ